MTKLTLERDGPNGAFSRVYVLDWQIRTLEQFTTWVRDCAMKFEREIKESQRD